MNVDNINKLLSHLKNLPQGYGFDMSNIDHECGTAFCIAGWACHIFNYGKYDSLSGAWAGKLLGLTSSDLDFLCYPKEGVLCDFGYIGETSRVFTLPAAIRVLELLIEHGTMVDPDNGRNMWERAIAEQQQVIDRLEAARKPAKIDWIVELQKPVLDLPEYERAVRELGPERITE